ncbi:MAG TPA: hypothetical protein VNU94_05270 [Acidobacteriaceae bacterium]|jgi:hypothetical protein|nr:hypothetical protein [Acidobacteriaceae bacterium]
MSVTFEEWVYAVFHHPESRPEWYWDAAFEALWEKLTDTAMVRHMTRLFLEPELLRHYSLVQVAQGITFLIDDASPGESSAALFHSEEGRPEVPLAERVACIEAMGEFFRRFVVPAAPGPAEIESNPFHAACYAWWDIFPMRFLMQDEEQAVEPELQQAALKVMAEVLNLPSELCQLSALHGLSHWHRQHAEQVEQIVEGFVDQGQELTPQVREYLLEKLV